MALRSQWWPLSAAWRGCQARETPFWDRYFEVIDLLVGTENGYARTYGLESVATITT